MSRSSSRHKREIQGKDSAGETSGDHGEEGNTPRPVPPVYGNRSSPADTPLDVDLSSGWIYPVPGKFSVTQVPTGCQSDGNARVWGTPTIVLESISVRVVCDGVASEAFTWDIT